MNTQRCDHAVEPAAGVTALFTTLPQNRLAARCRAFPGSAALDASIRMHATPSCSPRAGAGRLSPKRRYRYNVPRCARHTSPGPSAPVLYSGQPCVVLLGSADPAHSLLSCWPGFSRTTQSCAAGTQPGLDRCRLGGATLRYLQRHDLVLTWTRSLLSACARSTAAVRQVHVHRTVHRLPSSPLGVRAVFVLARCRVPCAHPVFV